MGLCKPYYGLGKFYARKIKKIDRKVKKLTAKKAICEAKLEKYKKTAA